MKYFSIIIFTILLSSCCGRKGVGVIKDKSWFPYKLNSNIVYKTRDGIIDSLSITQLDTSIHCGDFCAGCSEFRSCKLLSNKFNDFKIDVSLDADEILNFVVYHSNKFINLYYRTSSNKMSSNPNELNLIDSVNLNNETYHNMLILNDSTNDFRIYYNHNGILRYIINKDTFDLKN